MSLNTNLTSLYPLTSDVTDSQGNYNGTNVGVTFANDAAMGDVATFNGGYYTIPSGLETGITSSYSVSMWVKPDALQALSQTLFMDGQSGSTFGAIQTFIAPDGRIVTYHYPANSAAGAQSLYSTSALPMASWTHVTFSWDGSDMRIYFNGVLDNTGAMTAIPWDNHTSFWVGGFNGRTDLAYNGKMSDFRFWTDRALSAADASQLSLETGLVANWNFDDNTGDDSVGSANGTVTDLTYATADGITYAEADGSGNKMDLGTPAALNLGTSDFTISGWANMDVIPTGASGAVLYNKGMTSLSSPKFDGYQISFYQGNVRFFVGGQGSYTAITQPMSTGQWYHFMGTRSGTTMKLYINGVLADTQDTGTIKDVTSPLNGTIFSNYNGSWYTDAFDGKLADIRIWSRSLSDGEAASVHTTGPEVAATPLTLTDGLIAKYKLDDAGLDVGLVPFNGATLSDDALSLPAYSSGIYPSTPVALGSTYTISMWFKDLKARSGATSQWLMMDGYSNTGTNGNWAGTVGNYTMSIYTGNTLGAWDTAWRSSGYVMTQANFAGNGWHNIVASFDNGTLTYYIDGTQVGNTVSYSGSPNIQVFGSWQNYSYAFADEINDVRVWSRALTATEAAELNTAGAETPPTLTDGLVAKYPLDTNGVPSIGDVTFTASNVTYGAGESFSTFASQNSGYYVNSPYLDLADEYTLSFWFKDLKSRAAAASNFLMAVAYNKETGGVGGYANWDHDTNYDVTVYTNDMLGAYGHANASAGTSTFNSTGYQMTQALYTGTGWHHMTCVFSSGQMTYYINGVQVGVPVATTGMDKLQTIGSYTNYNYGAFDYMDDFRVWNRALSAADTATLFAAGAEETEETPAEDPPSATDPRNLPTTSVSNNQVARWLFEDDYIDDTAGGSGLVFGAVGSPSFVDGKHAGTKAVQIDQGDYFTFPSTLSAASVTGWSFAVWVKEDGNGTQTNGPYGYEGNFMTDSTAVNASKSSINMPHANGYTMWDFDTAVNGGGQRLSTNTITFADFADWVHIVATKDKASGLMKLYKNGVLVSSATRNANLPSITTAFKFGYGWAGIIDSIEIYNKSLSDAEALEVYDASAPLASSYDWTHGVLTNIVKFSRGLDGSGNPSYAYAKKESGDSSTTLYFATDFQTWSTFDSYASGVSLINGAPVCMEYGPNGKVLVGTDSGKLYEIDLDSASIPQSYSLLYTMPGGQQINTIKYNAFSQEWIFESFEKMQTIPLGGGAVSVRYSLAAGSKCIDIAAGEGHAAMMIQKADFTLEPLFAISSWSVVHTPSTMISEITTLDPKDINYDSILDKWVAADTSTGVTTTSDLLLWLTS